MGIHRDHGLALPAVCRSGDSGLDPVELWLDGELGLWQARHPPITRGAAVELPADEQRHAAAARTDYDPAGEPAGRTLSPCQPGLALCDDRSALPARRQMDLE